MCVCVLGREGEEWTSGFVGGLPSCCVCVCVTNDSDTKAEHTIDYTSTDSRDHEGRGDRAGQRQAETSMSVRFFFFCSLFISFFICFQTLSFLSTLRSSLSRQIHVVFITATQTARHLKRQLRPTVQCTRSRLYFKSEIWRFNTFDCVCDLKFKSLRSVIVLLFEGIPQCPRFIPVLAQLTPVCVCV